MSGLLKMRKRVRVPRVLAATDVSARQAHAKRNPVFFAQRHAFATPIAGGDRVANQREMFATLHSHYFEILSLVGSASPS